MGEMTKFVWREWFNADAVKKLTEMGTLPRNETEIDARWMTGEEVAAKVHQLLDDVAAPDIVMPAELPSVDPEVG